MSDFIAKYVVCLPIVRPILAQAGQILTVWPRSATHTLAVCAFAPGFPVLTHAAVPVGALYGIVLMWEADGIIRPLSASSALRRSA